MAVENDSRRVTLTDVVDLCRALEIPLAELLAGAPDEVMQQLGIDRRVARSRVQVRAWQSLAAEAVEVSGRGRWWFHHTSCAPIAPRV